jgi:hypothetical protein
MSADTLTALGVVVAAVAGLVTAVGIFIVRVRVEKVHVMVNSRQDRMEARIEELSGALREANVKIPTAPAKKEAA